MDRRTNPVETQHLLNLYTKKGLTLREIGAQVGMTHAGVSLRLKKAGVKDSKVKVQCYYCKAWFKVNRSKHKHSPQHFYCSVEHYRAKRANPNYMRSSYGGRLSRALVAKYFPLERGHVVHHVDSDQRNVDLSNLWVFKNQADHISFHHHGKTKPIWKG